MFTRLRSLPPFTQTIATTIGGLILLSILLTIMTYFQGPRVHAIDADLKNATTMSRQRVTFHLNQPVESIQKKNVTIEPAVPFTITTNGKMVTLEFDSKLRYGQRYSIDIKEVFNVRQRNVASSVNYAFTTGPGALYYLKRQYSKVSQSVADKPADRIVRTHLGSTRGEEVYRSARIQEFVVAGDYLVICVLNNDFTTSLRALDLRTNETKVLTIPGKGIVSNLRTLPGQSVVGMSFSTMSNGTNSPQYSNALLMIDVETNKIKPVEGFAGKELEVQEWAFSPDGSTVIAHLTDKTVVAASLTSDTQPVPYGQVMRVRNVSSDGTKVAVMLRDGPASLDLVTRGLTPFVFRKRSDASTYPLDVRMYANRDGYLARLNVTNSEHTNDMTYITSVKNGVETIIYTSNGQFERIDNFYTAPNDQYMIIEKHPASSTVYDDYGMSSQPVDSQTVIIDMSTNKIIKTVMGRQVEIR